MRSLPSGTVTFLFTDIEGSTRLLHELGAEGYGEALAEHRRGARCARGYRSLAGLGAHGRSPGSPLVTAGEYVGVDVHVAARICSAAHGGQVLVSKQTRELLDRTFELRDLGDHRLKGPTAPQRLSQLGDGEFPALKTLYRTNLPVQPSRLVGRERELLRQSNS